MNKWFDRLKHENSGADFFHDKTDNSDESHAFVGFVSFVTGKENECDLIESLEERAAIMEFDAGMPRCEAEKAALRDLTERKPDE
ncbi:MAG: hypothetical protein ACLFP8_08755 [Alphaproteobacteria bacterium]